jgi:hypothetical protein
MEAVAAEIRALPQGGTIREDYEFDHIDANGAPAKVRLSELFRPGTDSCAIGPPLVAAVPWEHVMGLATEAGAFRVYYVPKPEKACD